MQRKGPITNNLYLLESLQSVSEAPPLPGLWTGGMWPVLGQQSTNQVQELRDGEGLSKVL